MTLEALFSETDYKNDKWIRIFARFFGIYYEWLLVPWLKEKGEILAGPSMEDKDLKPQRPRVRVWIDSKERNLDYDWLLRQDDSIVLIEAKCWIAYSGFKKKFEDNDYISKFQSKYEARAKDNFGLYCFVCHTDDFVVIAPPEHKEKRIDERWLLWWDSEGGIDGTTCEPTRGLTVFSIKDILKEKWHGVEDKDHNVKSFIKPLEDALNVLKHGTIEAIREETKGGT